MPARVSFDKFRSLMAGLVCLAAVLAGATSGSALAGPQITSTTAGGGAARVSANTAAVDDKNNRSDDKMASSGEAKAKDPLADLKVSDQAKAHQERADRALAENGETRVDDEDADEGFAADDAGKSRDANARSKSVTAGIKCVAGCN